MKKIVVWVCGGLCALSVFWSLYAMSYAWIVGDSARTLKNKNTRDILALKERISELESVVEALPEEKIHCPDCPVFLPTDETEETETITHPDIAETESTTIEAVYTEPITSPTDTEADTQPCNTPAESQGEESVSDETISAETTAVPIETKAEDVTETVAPTPDETTITPTIIYRLAAHEGQIGVFDAEGNLIRVLNVYIMTLPEADRIALTEGIAVYSEEEMQRVIGKYI